MTLGGVPEPEEPVTAARDDQRSVGSERRIGEELRAAAKGPAGTAGCGVPEPGRAVLSGREDLASTGHKARREHSSSVAFEWGDETVFGEAPQGRWDRRPAE